MTAAMKYSGDRLTNQSWFFEQDKTFSYVYFRYGTI